MKTFIVIVSLIASVCASPSGWGAPPSNPSILVELSAAAAAAAEGTASADQQLVEAASGDVNNPASIVSSSGVYTEVSQEIDITQLAQANVPAGSTQTIQDVSVQNLALGQDSLVADVSGANLALVEVSGSSAASGSGELAEAAVTVNEVSSKKN